jgi:hypothetical protein
MTRYRRLACRLKRLLQERESYVALSWSDIRRRGPGSKPHLFNDNFAISGIGFFPESVTRDRLFLAKEAAFAVLLQMTSFGSALAACTLRDRFFVRIIHSPSGNS